MIHEAPELLPTHYYQHQLSQQQHKTDAKVNRVFWMIECWINTFLLHYMQKDAKIWRQEKSCVQAASATVGGDQRSPPQFLLWLQREEEKKKTEEFATEQLQVNPNKHPTRWRSKHSRTNPGSSKEPSMTCHDKKVNFIPSSLFPLTWNSLQGALGNTPPPHVPSSISRQESPCVSLSSLKISLPRALLLALQRDFLAPLIYNFSLQEIYSFIFFFKK